MVSLTTPPQCNLEIRKNVYSEIQERKLGHPDCDTSSFFFFCIVELVLGGYLVYRCACYEPFRCVTRSFSEEMERAVLSTSVEEGSSNLDKIRDIDAS